ncbi:unnamed protein product [Fraxinus pennsylvanica]|uniref:Uncharacterized protein n=1 Tax=Fraxinus pennsylvanica TaxID=56036 RepID=A0AAD1YUZ5_9LAMI|nr:unnamed protein product [Fraxinus pennsylvanica]
MWNDLAIFIEKSNHKGYIDLEDKRSKLKKSSDKVLSECNIPKKMKLKFTKAWISFLQLPLPLDVYKEVLVTLHQKVIPHLSKPIMLCRRHCDDAVLIDLCAILVTVATVTSLFFPPIFCDLFWVLAVRCWW